MRLRSNGPFLFIVLHNKSEQLDMLSIFTHAKPDLCNAVWLHIGSHGERGCAELWSSLQIHVLAVIVQAVNAICNRVRTEW